MDYQDERMLEDRIDALEEEWDESHPRCPQCENRMLPMKEKYDLDFPYEDKWYECTNCGYSVSR